MIAVIGRLASGPATEVARRVARAGGVVELVVTVPPGKDGDRALLELAGSGVGHAAALRSPAPQLEAADVELALRYLPDPRVVVLADPDPSLAVAARDAASWAGATLVQLTSDGRTRDRRRDAAPGDQAGPGDGAGPGDQADPGDPVGLDDGSGPDDASRGVVVLDGPRDDPDGAFAGVVAALAVRLDAGASVAAAWSATTSELGLERLTEARGAARPAP